MNRKLRTQLRNSINCIQSIDDNKQTTVVVKAELKKSYSAHITFKFTVEQSTDDVSSRLLGDFQPRLEAYKKGFC